MKAHLFICGDYRRTENVNSGKPYMVAEKIAGQKFYGKAIRNLRTKCLEYQFSKHVTVILED